MIKNYCETHHLYYSTQVCPFCQNEKHEKIRRANKVNNEHNKPVQKQEDNKPIEITDDVLSKLQNHFKQ